jgi:hypothetical protein
LNCDDANSCTTDSCSASGGCVHAPLICDDGLLDTVDSCEPATGACLFTPIVPDEVASLQFLDALTLAWSPAPGATHWNTYRGTISRSGGLGSRPAGEEYDHVCFESADLGGNGATRTVDVSTPVLGLTYYYLVTGENSAVEGPAGVSTLGTPRVPPSPCVTPP